jgi:HSP90 family molecular chaperone/class 3 adenylate cyclase
MSETGRDYFKLTYEHLKLIAKDIFGESPSAAIREVIQNAHDAILIRAAQAKTGDENWAVHITLDPDKKTITIKDDGIGMSLQDIQENLTVLGASTKKDLVEKYKNVKDPSRREKLENVAGIFGFGFVASLIISKEIELWTKKDEPNAQGVYCRFGRKAEYEWEKRDDIEVGTKLVLHIDEKVQEIKYDQSDDYAGEISRTLKGGNILHPETVTAIVQKYCDLLEYDIRLVVKGFGGGEISNWKRINLKVTPWEIEEHPSQQELLEFFKRRVGQDVNEPLHVIKPFRFDREEDGIKGSGILYIPDPGIKGKKEMGYFDIFVKRIWVCEGEIGLLPPWATFLKGIIISPDLVPKMDRQELDRTHASYHRLKEALRKRIYAYFKETSINKTQDFKSFLDVYGIWYKRGLLTELADYEKRAEVYPHSDLLRTVPFKVFSQTYTSGRLLTLNSYIGAEPDLPLSRVGKERHKVYAPSRVVGPDRQGEYRKLVATRTINVIIPECDEDLFLLAFIEKTFRNNVEMLDPEVRLLKDYMEILKTEEQEKWSLFIEAIKEFSKKHLEMSAGFDVTVGNIPKVNLPAMIAQIPQEKALVDEQGDGEDFEKTMKDRYRQVIVLNAKNKVMSSLLEYCESQHLDRLDEFSLNCLHKCYHMALMDHSGGSIPPQFLEHDVDLVTQYMQSYVEREEEFYSSQRKQDEILEERTKLENENKRQEELLNQYKLLYGDITPDAHFIVPETPEPRWCAILITDIDSSTTTLSNLDFEDRGDIFSQYIEKLKEHVHKCNGFFDKFTGDGFIALFGVGLKEKPIIDQIRTFCTDAKTCAEGIQLETNKFCQLSKNKQRLEDENLKNFQSRTAIAFGKVAFGKFGGTGSVVGKAIIEAARMCEKKEFFENTKIIVSGDFLENLGQLPGHEFHLIEKDFVPRGLNRKFSVYGK